MAVQIDNLEFEGPFEETRHLEPKQGVYVILCRRTGKLGVIDVGMSRDVRSRVEQHERQGCWIQECAGVLAVAARYLATEAECRVLERSLRDLYRPPCGEY